MGQEGRTLNTIVSFVVAGKFYPLFACLFGIGFALQFERWGDRPGFVWLYVRRLLALAVIAFTMIALTGYKVLESYAFWGFTLLLGGAGLSAPCSSSGSSPRSRILAWS